MRRFMAALEGALAFVFCYHVIKGEVDGALLFFAFVCVTLLIEVAIFEGDL